MFRRNRPTRFLPNNCNLTLTTRIGIFTPLSSTCNNTSDSTQKVICCSSTLSTSRRNVQFRKTSQMQNAMNSSKKAEREKWVADQTQDYAERLEVAKKAGLKLSQTVKPIATTFLSRDEKSSSGTSSSSGGGPQLKKQEAPVGSFAAGKSRWTTTSTKDFADAAAAAGAPSPAVGPKETQTTTTTKKTDAKEEDERITKHRDQFDRATYEQWERIRTFSSARTGRFKTYFAEYGWGFFTFYTMTYVLTFVIFYLMLKMKWIDYRSLFEFIFIATFGAIDRKTFFAKMDEANPMYMDLLFAFVINEVFDIWRFPVAIASFMALRHWWMKKPVGAAQKGMFRDLMPEAALKDEVKHRTEARRKAMGRSGSSLATAAAMGRQEVKPPSSK